MSEFLVVVSEEIVRDTQILDMSSENIKYDEEGYVENITEVEDWFDFEGSVVLGLYRADNKYYAIEMAKKEFGIKERFLKAYEVK